MNKIAKTALMTGTALCVAGVVLSTAGYFAGGKDFTYASDHVYVSGGNSSAHKNLAVMKKEQIDDFTKLNVDFEDLDLDIRTSDDDHYYMEYKLEKNGKKAPLTWEDKDGELTLKESEGGTGGYFITYDLGVFRTHIEQTQKEDAVNTVILYVPEKAQLLDAEIQLSDGDMDVKELQCTDNMQLKAENGDVSIKKADLADGQIALDDGELQMGNSSFNGDMEITNSNGDVSIQMKNGNVDKTNIYLKTTDGDVDTRDLSRGKSSNEEDLSVYENKVGASAPTLNVNSSDGDITLTESAR